MRAVLQRALLLPLVASTTACWDFVSADVPRTESITITAPRTSLLVGDTVRLVVTPRKRDGSPRDRPYSLTSSDVRRATVTTGGLVTAVSAGTVRIEARSDGKSAQLQFVIHSAPQPSP